jgi:hypothetical protein
MVNNLAITLLPHRKPPNQWFNEVVVEQTGKDRGRINHMPTINDQALQRLKTSTVTIWWLQ